MVCPGPPVCLVFQELRVCLDQRETQVSPEVLEDPEETDLMEVLEPKESLVYLVSQELAAHPDPLPRGRLGYLEPLEHQDRWDHQDTLEAPEPRVTLVPPVWTSQVCPETEDRRALMELQDPSEPQDLPEDLDGTVFLVCQELKETWAQSEHLDLLEVLEDLEVLVAPDLKVSLAFQAEMVFQELQDLKESEETQVFKDLLG